MTKPQYAQKTSVTVERSRAEIEQTLKRYGADAFGYGQDGGRAVVTFRLDGRMMRVDVDVPGEPQEERQRWRAVLLMVKAKCEAVAIGVETVEQAWLPYILLPDNTTVGQYMVAQIEETYRTGTMPSLLPGVAGHLGAGGRDGGAA